MRLKSWLWISALVFLMGSVPVFAHDRDQDQSERSKGNREEMRKAGSPPPEGIRGPEKDVREAEREREKEWREYLKERKKAYKEWAKANRGEQNDFDKYRRKREMDRREAVREADKNYRESNREREKDLREAEREREREWHEYLKERKKDYKDWSRASHWERDDFDQYRRDRRRQYGGQYGGWGSGNQPRDGACFYMDAGYRGENFCINSNERQRYIGERYNDRISSIRVFGRARIVVYEHENFGGASRTFSGDAWNLVGDFNDRISSIEVR